jgi:hypothetical protein
MKKQMPFLIVTSLLMGLIITVATSRISWINIHGDTCGHSLYATQDNLGTPINDCNNNEYGWPARYAQSSANVFVLNHSGPAGATVYTYTSFSRLRVGADWVFWSAISSSVIFCAAYLTRTSSAHNKKKTKK